MAETSVVSVTVDRDFARFGSKSYAINKINTVEVRDRNPHGRGGAIICGIIAAICLLNTLALLTSAKFSESGTTIVLAIVFGALAYWLWQKSKIVEYRLFLMTSSSEAQAFITNNKNEVYNLRDRIESAMAGSDDGR